MTDTDRLIAEATADLDRLVEGVRFTRSMRADVAMVTRGVVGGCLQNGDIHALAALVAVAVVRLAAPPRPCEHSEALSLAAHALRHAPNACPFHGVDFGFLGMQRGEPRCDSCKQPYRVARALAALRPAPTPSGGTAPKETT